MLPNPVSAMAVLTSMVVIAIATIVAPNAPANLRPILILSPVVELSQVSSFLNHAASKPVVQLIATKPDFASGL
jgi:hypothetical protein